MEMVRTFGEMAALIKVKITLLKIKTKSYDVENNFAFA